ncbi:glycoside hydrolase family 2 protein [Thalassotalea agarivorans]|uniref:Glycosyl hydrolases family 2, TIM barrel domain n=1 Tax=Thalassotalea agarivorans TaxID=349064 RepID=A0A1I0GY27_THASX|nr:sugar-binding domain-containing protein [Thalassotalea agarivorans]SET75438.1 Glycosyl hydrolases family 2, TIM barrel domain [Thalassotalea agarivorans]
MFKLSVLKQTLIFLMALVLSPFLHAQKSHHETQSLDGQWQIIFDKENNGKTQQLYKNANFLAQKNIKPITVPSVWERIEKDYEGVAIYRKAFKVDAAWQDNIVHINFDAVNYRAEVYLNDHVVGVHEGGFTPFSFRIDSMLHFDKENVITLRVVGPILLDTDKVIDGMGAMETPQWRGGITGGIWQSVRLIASKKTFIDDLYVHTNLATNETNVALEITNFDEFYSKDTVRIDIEEVTSGKIVATQKLDRSFQPGKNAVATTIKIKNPQYWSPDSPFLYKAIVTLIRDGEKSHAVSDRFGYREFTIQDKRFYLNGKETYVKAVFLEGVYPVGVATPIDLAMARKEIQLAKEAGFNMIRPWRRPPQPEWLDLADEMGVMVIGSPVLECMDLPVNTPDLPRRVNFEITETIRKDRNRPSIVMWELFNELRRPILKQMMAETAMLARDNDPSRLILDESGGWAFGAKVYLPHSRKFEHFNDVHTYPGPNMTNLWYDKFLGVGHTAQQRKALGIKGKPIGHNVKENVTSFVSELGYGSYVDYTRVNAQFAEQGNPIVPATRYHKKLGQQLEQTITTELSNVYQSPTAFYHEQQEIHALANARMIEATRANANVTGYCVHALTGGDWIMGAGILDLWRNPKEAVYEKTKAANQPRILSLRTFPRNAYVGSAIKLSVTGINDLSGLTATLHVEVTDAHGNAIWQHKKAVDYRRHVSQLMQDATDKIMRAGKYLVTATLSENGKTITQNTIEFDVFDLPTLSKNPIAIVDETGRLRQYLTDQNQAIIGFTDNLAIDVPVIVALKQNQDYRTLNQQLQRFAERGGHVIYLQFPYQRPKWNSGVLSRGYSQFLPFEVDIKASSGLWAGMSHVVAEHPIFEKLPQNQAMYGVYENVRAKMSMVGIEHDHIVTVVANDNFPDMTLMKRHYAGPGDVWTGTDITSVKLGRGEIWLNTLELIPHLSRDPVADIITNNLINYVLKRVQK